MEESLINNALAPGAYDFKLRDHEYPNLRRRLQRHDNYAFSLSPPSVRAGFLRIDTFLQLTHALWHKLMI